MLVASIDTVKLFDLDLKALLKAQTTNTIKD
jgi:hypothetical protein